MTIDIAAKRHKIHKNNNFYIVISNSYGRQKYKFGLFTRPSRLIIGMDEKELKTRTKEFAHRCVKLSMALPKTYLGTHTKGQLIRFSTSVASNYRAVCVAQSKGSFISKFSIVIEEADETYFWLEFIIDERLLGKERVLPLLREACELTSIFISSRKPA